MDEQQPVVEAKSGSKFDQVSFYVVLIISLLLPIFFIPFFSFALAKAVLVYGLILLLAIFWILTKLKDGSVTVPRNLLAGSAILVPVVFAISSLFSGELTDSFFGMSLEIGTTLSLVFVTALMFMTASALRTKHRVFVFYLVFFASFFIVALFQILRMIFGIDFLNAGIFTIPTSNLIGKWNELGIFFGLSALLSVITLESLKLSKAFKALIVLAFIISLFFLAIINFTHVLVVLSLFALVSTVYWFVFKKNQVEGGADIRAKKVAFASLILLVVSLVFVFGGDKIMSKLDTYEKAKPFTASETQIEAFVPGWKETALVTKDVLMKDPIFGVGPHLYEKAWLTYKPASINPSLFWNVDFTYARGLVPTYFATTGILGIFSLLLFFWLFLYKGFQAIFVPTKDVFARYALVTSFLGALYLWVFQVIYVPSEVLFVLTFIFTGVFFAVLYQTNQVERRIFTYSRDPRVNFVTVLVLIVVLIGAVVLGYSLSKKVIGTVWYQKSLTTLSVKGDVAAAEKMLEKAAAYDPRDIYYRALTDINILKVRAILSQQDVKTDVIQSQLLAVLPTVIDRIERAVNIDRENYQNWIQLGKVYEGLLPLGYPEAYVKANAAYLEAQKLNPKSPLIYILLAQLEAANKNVPKAKELILKSVELKPNYTEAAYLWAQLEINEGNIKGAISSIGQIALLSPNNPTVFFQLGFLQYSDKDYKGAIQSFERAVTLRPEYSNARYFLGLSLAKLGRNSDAIAQFVEIQKYNPENTEVQTILRNLRAGRDPLSGISGSTSTPAKSTDPKKLPVDED